jgi:hypothetical protein
MFVNVRLICTVKMFSNVTKRVTKFSIKLNYPIHHITNLIKYFMTIETFKFYFQV